CVRGHQASSIKPDDYSFSTETEVAFVTAKTLSPSFRFIRSTEPVVIIDVTIPAAVLMTTSDTTLSEVIFSIVPGKWFRMLVLMMVGLFASDGHTETGKASCVKAGSKCSPVATPPVTNP